MLVEWKRLQFNRILYELQQLQQQQKQQISKGKKTITEILTKIEINDIYYSHFEAISSIHIEIFTAIHVAFFHSPNGPRK